MVFSLLLNYSWFIIITWITNGSLLAGVSMIKKMSKTNLRNKLLTPLDFNKKFFDDRVLVGDHIPVAGIVISAFWSVLFFLIYKEIFAFLLPLAVFVGDILGSFFKRRIAMPHGRSLLFVDQLNFFVAAYFTVLWLGINFPVNDFIVLAVLTFFVHIATNIFAYKIGIKDKPW
jgi:CDP-2,3-bis-(O-geranylgeranyl)-sn-glycerol synthase